jgi:hypothetical protein
VPVIDVFDTPRRAVVLAAAAWLSAAGCQDDDMDDAGALCEELRATAPSQCGPSLDLTPINDYRGEIEAVQDREDAVVLLASGCTGTLIAAADGPVVLTAGHCVGLGDDALLAFNVEADADGDTLATVGVVVERSTEPDYALIELDTLPAVTATPLTARPTDLLAVIQHPRGGPKAIAEGRFAITCDDEIFYNDLDTLVGSSGAGVLTRGGYLLGIHTDGDCAEDGSGSNYGWSATSIVAASSYLQDSDVADR